MVISTTIFTLMIFYIFDRNQVAYDSHSQSIEKLSSNRMLLKSESGLYRSLSLTATSINTGNKDIILGVQRVLVANKRLISSITEKSNKIDALKFRINDLQNEFYKVIETYKDTNTISKDKTLNLIASIEQISKEVNSFEESHWKSYLEESSKTLEQYKNFNNFVLVIYGLIYAFFMYISYINRQKSILKSEKEQAEDFYFKLFSSLNEGIILCTSSGEVKACNKSAQEVLGKEESKVLGKDISTLFRDAYFVDDVNEYKGSLSFKRILGFKAPQAAIVMASHDSDSNMQWFSLNTQPVAEGGKIHSVIFSITDITSRVNSQKLIKQQQMKIFETSKHQAIGEIASGIAHEINNPLAIISMSIEKLELKADMFETMNSFDVQKVTSRVSKTIDRISKVVKGFLSYSRGEKQEMENVSIRLITNIALDLYQMKLNEQNIDLMVNDAGMDVEIECNPTQIAQVLINLIKNAAQAISELEDKWIRVETTDNDDNVIITVEDSGTDMTEEIKAEILKPFFTTKGFGEGTGLGLSISKTIIEEHGGELDVLAEPHTKFVITLPKKQEEESEDDFMAVA